jgi:hypothetical protein
MKRDNKAFYEFFKKNCEFRKQTQIAFVCKKLKAVNKIFHECQFEICPYIKKENQDILNPACELLRILDIDFYHEQRTSTSKRDILKSNKSLPDLIIFMDKKLLAIELKKPGQEKLKGGQETKAQRFMQKEYIEHHVISRLLDFFNLIVYNLNGIEDDKFSQVQIKVKKWLDKNNLGAK